MRLLTFFATLISVGLVSLSAQAQPNIVVVLADDVGTGDVSYSTRRFLNKEPVFNTPNIKVAFHQPNFHFPLII